MERVIATESSLMKKTKKDLVNIILKNDVNFDGCEQQLNEVKRILKNTKQDALNEYLIYNERIKALKKENKIWKIITLIVIITSMIVLFVV